MLFLGFRKLLLALFISTLPSSAWDINDGSNRAACQSITSNPLDGCNEGNTVLVGAGGFPTVQSAVLSLPNNTDAYIILIEPGNYTEQVNVTRIGPTYLLGQTSSPKDQSLNIVQVKWASLTGNPARNLTFDNAFTATLTVAPSLDADLTGSGLDGHNVPAGTVYGSSDFRTYNIDFINDFIDYGNGPSLALSVAYANAAFYQTGFYSYQDTVYVGKFANAYFKGGEVAGEADFFYGFGTAFVTNTSIKLRNCGGGITAWKGTNTTIPNKFGVYINNSTVSAANTTIATTITNTCALGRPWNAQHRSIFAYTYLDASILPTGYVDWKPSHYTKGIANASVNNWGFQEYATLQAEYMNFGPGYNATGRALSLFDTVLTEEQFAPFSSPAEVFAYEDTGVFGYTGWIDFDA